MLRARLSELCREHRILAIYLLGSRAADGLALLDRRPVERAGSDLDIGVAFLAGQPGDHREMSRLQIELEELFAPLRVDLVPLDRVDALFQFAAIDGHRVAVLDDDRADRWELDVMRRAAELLPIQRWIEREKFGVATT
jgi:predicted nucleotidyltransferase